MYKYLNLRRAAAWMAGLCLVGTMTGCKQDEVPAAGPGENEAVNTLTPQEQAEGWQLLFNGQDLGGWRGYSQEEIPDGWVITPEGEMHFTGEEGKQGDIMTAAQYDDFELSLEWKIAPGSNSGIMYRVTNESDRPWHTGPEMQIIDNSLDVVNPLNSTGSNYDLHAPTRDVTRPVGEYNETRLVVNGNHVEHWLNGEKVVEYELGSPEWEALVAKSKFGEHPKYGRNPSGHILLQNHGDPVWFRNVKVRPL